MKCDCTDRVGIDIVTYKMFEEMKVFLTNRSKKEFFRTP